METKKSTQRVMDLLIDVEDGKIVKTYLQIEAFDEKDYHFTKEFDNFNEALRTARRILKKFEYVFHPPAPDDEDEKEEVN